MFMSCLLVGEFSQHITQSINRRRHETDNSFVRWLIRGRWMAPSRDKILGATERTRHAFGGGVTESAFKSR